jgi:hypothetical protein
VQAPDSPVTKTIPLLCGFCLLGFALIQLLFSVIR